MKKKSVFVVATFVGILAVASTAMALNNNSKVVRHAEVTDAGHVFIHLTTTLASTVPSCASHSDIVACNLSDAYCAEALHIALTAQTVGRPIDLEVSTTTCVSTFAKFSRIRMR